jgi:L-histidine N-alpha-methyltransferase
MERPGAATDQILACNLLGARDRHAELARDVRDGLSRPLKEIPPKYFYDARGSELFERITRLPEYYLTRVETEILERRATDFVSELGSHVLVEYGSGSSTKTRLLLDAMQEVGSLEQYAPVDVSEEALRTAADSLVREYPNLQVVIVIADFESPLDLSFAGRPRLVAFLGSTIGNFTSATARTFVRSVARQLGSGDGFLIGLNRELSADFDVEGFSHRAYYDAEKARIELHLVARGQQVVSIRDLEMEVAFAAGESIRTELSHKYTRESAVGLLEASGMRIRRWETDERNRFAVAIAEPV